LAVTADGSQALTWTPEKGAPWTVDLTGPRDEFAVDGAQPGTTCQGTPVQDPRLVVCDVSDGGWVTPDDDDASYGTVPSTRDDVVVLSASDGSVLSRWAVGRYTSVAVVEGVVAVAGLAGEHAVVTGYDAVTGAQRWVYRPRVASRAEGDLDEAKVEGPTVFVNAVGRFFVVEESAPATQALRPDGTEIRTIGDADAEPGSGYMSCDDDVRLGVVCVSSGSDGNEDVLLLGDDADPARDRHLAGGLVRTSVDDGSVPGLVLTDDGGVRAWDAPSGRPAWTLGSGTAGGGWTDRLTPDALVLRGVVYCTVGNTLVAVDGRTGERRWSVDVGAGASSLLTDGRQVLVAVENSDASYLVAFDLRSGERQFRADYPKGIDHLQPAGHRLVGYSDLGNGPSDFSVVS